MSAQLVQTSAQAYLCYGKENGKRQRQSKRQGQGLISCSTVTSVTGRPSTTAERNKKRKPSVVLLVERDIVQMIANVQCLPPARQHKIKHVQARMATRQHLTNKANQAAVCFVVNEYSDDPDTSAYMVGQNVLLPPEATEHITLTQTASAAVDTKNTATFNDRTMDDNLRAMGDRSRSQGQAGTKRLRAERIMVCCMELFCAIIRNKSYHCPKQRASPQTCVSFSLGHKGTIASTWQHPLLNARQVGQHLLVRAQADVKSFSHKASNAHFARLTCKICGTFRKEERHPQRQDPAACSHQHTDHRGSNAHTRKDVLCRLWNLH